MMATDRKLDERISGWLEAEAPGQLPDRVLRATFERTRGSRQRVGVRALLGRADMSRYILALGGAAVAVVVALVALNALGRPPDGSGGQPSPSPILTPEATVVPATASPEAGLPAGPHLLWDENGVRMTVTISDPGWTGGPAEGVLIKNHPDPPDGAGMIVFTGELVVFGDPCRWQSTRPDTAVGTVDDFVAAMSAQASRDATEPVDITLGGYAGKSIIVRVPDDANIATCDLGYFGSWGISGQDPTPYRYHQGPGQIDKLWVVDVDGTLVVIDSGHYAGTPPATVAEMEAIVESVTFE